MCPKKLPRLHLSHRPNTELPEWGRNLTVAERRQTKKNGGCQKLKCLFFRDVMLLLLFVVVLVAVAVVVVGVVEVDTKHSIRLLLRENTAAPALCCCQNGITQK